MKYKNTNLSAKVILCSENLYVPGARIYTFELEYPRFIHGEFMTHRQFSRNDMLPWAIQSSLSTGGSNLFGSSSIPEIDSFVWVWFELLS